MKYRLHFASRWIPMFLCILSAFVLFFYSCSSCKRNEAFYYSGNNKIEITISGDTLGMLLKDTLLNSGDSYQLSVSKIHNVLDSNFNNQGYDTVKRLSDRILLVLSPQQSKNPSTLEAQALVFENKNKKYATNTGYLVRIKGNDTPALITDEIIVQFNQGTSTADINDLFQRYNLNIKLENPFIRLQYTVRTNSNSRYNALKTSQKLKEDESIIKFAQINLIYLKKFNTDEDPPRDQFYSKQWNLSNGISIEGVTTDADIDADLAWKFTKGSKNVTIAIIDDGFDVQHEDLKNNFSHNSLEIDGNNLDDDNNTLVDDYIGWNFLSNDNRLTGGYHGTEVTGVAAAQDNDIGIRGSCPECGILPIRTDHSSEFDRDGLSFGYAIYRGAKIINCSWEYNGMPVPDNVIYAINQATEAGIVVVCAMSNSQQNYCSLNPDISSLPNTIAVSRSTSMDMYDNSGYGDCMDLLAPTGAEDTRRGSLRIVTTDISGNDGFSRDGRELFGCGPAIHNDYTTCFGGTSAAAPLTAGVAGLILSASSFLLTPKQVQYLLQDCADKIEPDLANYSKNGFSTGTVASGNQSTHGYGRINAYEAVKVISSDKSKGGHDGVDIFVRDNNFDWGNTEQPSNVLFAPVRSLMTNPESVDIKIDASGQRAPTNNDNFENDLRDELPVSGQTTKVYVRLRNRGYRDANQVTVKMYLAYRGFALQQLPGDFWTSFPSNSSDISQWKPLGTKIISSLPYSGCSVAGSATDEARIVSFDFIAPIPSTSEPNFYCLVIMIDSPDDPLVTELLMRMSDIDLIVPSFNNITYRNFSIR